MKTKNLILGLIAFVFAVGSAFASLLAPTDIFVKAKLTAQSSYTCVDTNVTCANSGEVRCTVTLPVENGNNATTTTFKDSGCTLAIFRPMVGVSNSAVAVYELQHPD